MPPEHSTLTARFLAAFNRIDASMRKRTKLENRSTYSFAKVANQFGESTFFQHGDFIRVVAELRNVLVHEKKHPSEELATPVVSIVSRLERIADEIESPERVEKRFVHDHVSTVTPEDSIKEVLQLVAGKDFSQFPVIKDGKIIGLLTENGIARWLSAEVASESMIEFAEVTVAMVIAHEEKRENMMLIGRLRVLNEVRMRFAENALLEASIITQAGKPDQKPLGIITRWDLIE
jgi:predicted transcriptional regulator